ncbi:MAG TPA: PVC-type heme-binding CxxCH protein [Planctomycetota bacterium]|nr:PVC-type heme-binding CxxCH protein [Planctomycetota bacterium]
MKTHHSLRFTVILSTLILLLALPALTADAKPLKALFLGDNNHHVPAERFKNLQPPMAERGITLTYTDKLEDLNAATLEQYDALIIYANWTTIAPDQEKALLDYVASGHGLVAIHCASACFGNSKAYIELVGGRFLRHGTGVFKDTIVAPDNPIMKDLKPIESWDETYVHDRVNPDRTVLANRVDDKGAEAYTWTRTHGKGRVFYTAWGHDQRTWMTAGFIDLIEHGIRWAAGQGGSGGATVFPDLKPREGLKAPPTKEAEGPIPLYRGGAAFGAAGKTMNTMQAPLSPEESQPHLVVPPGFEVQLYASEPDIVKPICMAWDERGRLWIAETFDYPNELQPAGQGHDRIKICEDTKGTGKADKFTVFAENLSIPTSICFANGGVIVHQMPETVFLKSSKNDDHADVKKTLFSGWGTGDTHAGPSNLRYGFDNWIYGMVGYSGFRGDVGGKHFQHSQGFYRFNVLGAETEYEFLRSTNNNTWGFGWSEDGIVFGSTANGCPSVYMPIPNRYYESVAGFSPARLETIATSNKFAPITEKVRQVDYFGGYTAAAGHALYTARSFPKEYWNRVAFVCEPTGHLVGQFLLQPHGADFTALNIKSFAASDDEWTAPIMAEVGPDGALWVIDWYNYIVQHNPTPQGFKTGRRGAYETPLRDKRHGRIYRIVYKGAKPYTPINLADAQQTVLADTLKNDNLFWRMTAQRLLIEKFLPNVIPHLCRLIDDQSVDELGLNPASIHALWVLNDTNFLSGSGTTEFGKMACVAAYKALKHPSAGTRRAAAQTIPRTNEGLTALLDAKLLDDSDAQVRMAALLALSEMPPSEAAGKAIFEMLKETRNNTDKWIPHAAIAAAARHDASFLKTALAGVKVDPAQIGKTQETPATPRNALPNASFENEANGAPFGWRKVTHNGSGEQTLSNVAHTGARSIQISSTAGGDISWSAAVNVRPNTDYKLSGWIKTENVKGARGALFNVHELQQATPGAVSKALQGTHDWTKIETTFNSGGNQRLTINCLFGGWGQSTGTAWYDDVELIAVGTKGPSLPGELGRALQIVTGNYARRGPSDTILQTLSALKDADPNLALPILDGLASGWPAGKAPELKDDGVALMTALMKALPESARGSLLALAERWGRRDIFAAESGAIAGKLETILNDAAKSPEERADAAKRMILLADSSEHVQAVLAQIKPIAAPALNAGLLAALGESKLPETGAALIANWKKLTPAGQRAAVVTLMRRSEWTLALLDAVEKKDLKSTDIAAEFWTQLKNNPEPEVSAKAKKFEKAGGAASSAELKELVEKLKPLTLQTGDIEKGKAAFEKTCMVCHTLNGKGGQVGPLLTGFGAHPKEEILVAIVDPNQSVEANYRLWNCKTNDGLIVSGRLESESQTSVEILDTTGVKHIIERKDIKILSTNNQSIMPEGLGKQLSEDDLKGILEYISQSKVKP